MRKAIIALILLIIYAASFANSTTHNFMLWPNFDWQDFTKSGIDYSLSLSTRFIDENPNFNQAVLKVGIGKSFDKNLALWIGYTFAPNQPVGSNYFNIEQRSWQQISWNIINNHSLSIVSRSLLEQRYLTENPDVAWRLRQRLTLEPDSVLDFLPEGTAPIIYDEVFFDLNHPQWAGSNTVGQNRAFVGVSSRIHKMLVFQLGYLNQYIVGRNSNVDNHIISLSLTVAQRT
jgi:hypothetical protein